LRPIITAAAVMMLAALLSAKPASQQRTDADATRRDIDDGRRWLEGADATSEIDRGARAVAFNDASQAERLLRRVIRSQPRMEAASQAHELLSRLYLRSGQYQRAIENLDQWTQAFPDRDDVRRERQDIEQFRGLPNQIAGPMRHSILPHEEAGDFAIPLSVNGGKAVYLLDTGAWISVMRESDAKRFGLRINGDAGRIGDASGSGVSIRTAVAKEVTIGGIRFQDVSFAVVPNDGPWAAVPPGHAGIIGMPLINALGVVQWSARGDWDIAGGSATTHGARNLTFAGNHLVLSSKTFSRAVFGLVDTGATTSDLNGNFADQFADVIEQSGSRERHDITGLGGTTSAEGVALPAVLFDIRGISVALRPAHVTFDRAAALGGRCCIGNVGLDVLTQTRFLTFDLTSMTLELLP
jgi:predicted aspartyl protease